MQSLPVITLLGTVILSLVSLFVLWPLLSALVSGFKQNVLIWTTAVNAKSATTASEILADAKEDAQDAIRRIQEIESAQGYIDPEQFMLTKVYEAQQLRKKLKI